MPAAAWLPRMLPFGLGAWLPTSSNLAAAAGEPVSSKLSPEGQRGGGALAGAAAGEVPTAEQRAAMADLHEPDPSLPQGALGTAESSSWGLDM